MSLLVVQREQGWRRNNQKETACNFLKKIWDLGSQMLFALCGMWLPWMPLEILLQYSLSHSTQAVPTSPPGCDAICYTFFFFFFKVQTIFSSSWGQAGVHLLPQPLCQSSFGGSPPFLATLTRFPSCLIQAPGNKWLPYEHAGTQHRVLAFPAQEPQLAGSKWLQAGELLQAETKCCC